MCGIAGFVGEVQNPNEILSRMVAILARRGPDASNTCVRQDLQLGLGLTRLAITDLDRKADQPTWNREGSVGLVFNGEIYNHRDLRKYLEAKGHAFQTDHSDTEVILIGHEEWGSDLFLRLNGMFAFALCDIKKRKLVFARDRFGKKPLYYSIFSGGMVFASSLKALLVYPCAHHRELDLMAVTRFFPYGYIPSPQTCYRSIRKLPCGWTAEYSIETGRLTEQPYLRIENLIHKTEVGDITAEEQLSVAFDRAVDRRLEADMPLGIFLSGGIDSSAVVAAASRLRPGQNLHTFSIGFRDPAFDESSYAEAVAHHFREVHRNQIINLDEIRSSIFTFLDHLDEPMGDPSILPTYLLAKMAREHVKVVLGGDGGDEMFAGYDPLKALCPARLMACFPASARRIAAAVGKHLPTPHYGNIPLTMKIKRGLRSISLPPSLWNPFWMAPIDPKNIDQLMDVSDGPEEIFADSVSLWEKMSGADDIQKTTAWFKKFYLQDGVLAKVDRASMQVALEVRSPFLGPDFASFARSLLSKLKFRNGQGKQVLRSVMKGVLPDKILQRPKKGFGIPLAAWMRRLTKDNPQIFLKHAESWGLRVERVEAMIQEHSNRRADHRQFLWCLLVLNRHMENLNN
jgi:asparagine synthase (glutamine-hydrolysing)